MPKGYRTVAQKVPPEIDLLVINYSNVLKIVDEAMEVVGQALLQQMLTVRGEKRKNITPQHLYLITKSLALIKLVYKNDRVLLPPKGDERSRTIEDMVKAAAAEAEEVETKQ